MLGDKIIWLFYSIAQIGKQPNYNTFFLVFCSKQESLVADMGSQLYNLRRK